jgi:hypothetical protein
MNFKEIHIGKHIEERVKETKIEMSRLCDFMCCTEKDVIKMYKSQMMDTDILLRWSKLLTYDFFRLYSQHLILYAPVSATSNDRSQKKSCRLPVFRKNIYTKEIVDFILYQIYSGEMTKQQVMERYRIPKTTLYKWIEKYKS